ncbi:MAG: DUF4296 domain-containing protein [Bacteroidales bacterium]|nr:DUF4296 domain-containing protein [Bacteroidales bacterium]
MKTQGKYIVWLCLISFALSFLGACQHDKPKILPKKEMAQVLADVYLTEAMLTQLDSKTKREWSKGLKNEYFQDISYHWILDKHHITEDDFYASVAHYSRHVNTMIDVLDMTADKLNAMKQDVLEREKLEAEAERIRKFNLKWQPVSIDEDFIELWAKSVYVAPADSLPTDTLRVDSLLRADSLSRIDTSLRIDMLADTLPETKLVPFEDQYYRYWRQSDEDLMEVLNVTRYRLAETQESDSLQVKTEPALEPKTDLERKPNLDTTQIRRLRNHKSLNELEIESKGFVLQKDDFKR